jgi:hypothetical protein
VFSVDASLYKFNGNTQGAYITSFPSMSGSRYTCFGRTPDVNLAPSSWPDDVQAWKLVVKITCNNAWYDCPIKYAIETSASDSQISGCTSSCRNWNSCPAGYTMKSGASAIVGNNAYSCCDTISSCSDWNACPPGYVLKSGASSIYGSSQIMCCDQTCQNWNQCPGGYMLKLGAASIPGSSQAVCCSQTCATWDACGSGFTLRADASSIPGSDSSSCCTQAATSCSDWDSCPSGYALKAGSSSIYGTSQSICCSQTCASWNGCSSGLVLRSDAASIIGSDSGTCCTQGNTAQNDCSTATLCKDACGVGSFSFSSNTFNGQTQYTCQKNGLSCCRANGQTLCSGWNGCTPGFKLGANASNIYGSSLSECCIQSARVSNSLPSFGTVNEFVLGCVTLLYFFSPIA